MAKMHSRKKGTSGSKKPIRGTKPTWIRYKAKEIELLVTKLAKEGKTGSQIGLLLRDSYGVPDVHALIGKSITHLLAEKKLAPELPEDLTSLMKRSILIRKHLEINKHDMTALRGLQLTESKIKRLAKYYKRMEKIPLNWKYDPEALRITTE